MSSGYTEYQLAFIVSIEGFTDGVRLLLNVPFSNLSPGFVGDRRAGSTEFHPETVPSSTTKVHPKTVLSGPHCNHSEQGPQRPIQR